MLSVSDSEYNNVDMKYCRGDGFWEAYLKICFDTTEPPPNDDFSEKKKKKLICTKKKSTIFFERKRLRHSNGYPTLKEYVMSRAKNIF